MAFLEISKQGPVAHIELNNPDKLNALGTQYWDTAAAVMAELDADLEVRVAVLSGRGRAFTAGLDLAEAARNLPIAPNGKGPDGARQARFHQMIRNWQGAVSCFERARVPVIAAVHGYCLGGGIDMITACDIRLASADAVFSVRETKIAMVADLGTLQRLPAIVGPGIARELVFTGRDFDANYAAQIGLVNQVLPDPDSLREAAFTMARQIADNPPLAVQGAKRVLNEAVVRDVDRGLEYVSTYNAAHLVTQDLGVAVTAAMTKQKPEFSGR